MNKEEKRLKALEHLSTADEFYAYTVEGGKLSAKVGSISARNAVLVIANLMEGLFRLAGDDAEEQGRTRDILCGLVEMARDLADKPQPECEKNVTITIKPNTDR